MDNSIDRGHNMFEKKKNVIDRETANNSFFQFCEDWEIDCDETGMSQDDKIDFDREKAKIVNAIMKGRMIYENECLIYTVSQKSSEKTAGKEIKIQRPKGAAYMEMDRFKEREGVHKTYAVLAVMTGQSSAFFANLDGIDLKPFMAVVTLFLAG